jgi:hypothetical protein
MIVGKDWELNFAIKENTDTLGWNIGVLVPCSHWFMFAKMDIYVMSLSANSHTNCLIRRNADYK